MSVRIPCEPVCFQLGRLADTSANRILSNIANCSGGLWPSAFFLLPAAADRPLRLVQKIDEIFAQAEGKHASRHGVEASIRITMNFSLAKCSFSLCAMILLTSSSWGGQLDLEQVKVATAELEKLTEEEMKTTGIPGIAVAVVFKDQVILKRIRRARSG